MSFHGVLLESRVKLYCQSLVDDSKTVHKNIRRRK
jgi:hypothetical protein